MTSAPPPTEFVMLWTAHARQVSAYIYSLVANWSDADDLLQETGVVLLQKFDQFESGTSFSAWACKVAHLKVLEFQRRRRPGEKLNEEFWGAIHDEARQLADDLDRRLDALAECLGHLSEKDRRLLRLRYHDDCSVPTIAEIVGRTVAAVYKALERSHEALLDCVRRKLEKGSS